MTKDETGSQSSERTPGSFMLFLCKIILWFDGGDLWILSTGDQAGNRVSACGLLQGMISSASLPFHPPRLLPQNVRHVPLPCHCRATGRLVIFDSGFDPRLQARIVDAGAGVSHMGHCASLVRQLLCLSQKQSHTQNPSESATKPLWHSQKCRSLDLDLKTL